MDLPLDRLLVQVNVQKAMMEALLQQSTGKAGLCGPPRLPALPVQVEKHATLMGELKTAGFFGLHNAA